jgi:hypothetical protein
MVLAKRSIFFHFRRKFADFFPMMISDPVPCDNNTTRET